MSQGSEVLGGSNGSHQDDQSYIIGQTIQLPGGVDGMVVGLPTSGNPYLYTRRSDIDVIDVSHEGTAGLSPLVIDRHSVSQLDELLAEAMRWSLYLRPQSNEDRLGKLIFQSDYSKLR